MYNNQYAFIKVYGILYIQRRGALWMQEKRIRRDLEGIKESPRAIPISIESLQDSKSQLF